MDVVVVGGGVVGLNIAPTLARRGAQVVVVDVPHSSADSETNTGLLVPSLSGPLPAPGVLPKSLSWLVSRTLLSTSGRGSTRATRGGC